MGGVQCSELGTNNNFKDQAHDNSISALIRVAQLHSFNATFFLIIYEKLVADSTIGPVFVSHWYCIYKYVRKKEVKDILNTDTVSITTVYVHVSDKLLRK